jgi:putative Holliday junction resolvase
MICSTLPAVPFRSESSLAASLVDTCRARGVSLVVVGLPVSADGSEGEGCARARRIRERLLAAGLACELWDESWSSREAAEALAEAGVRGRAARGKLDSAAAAVFLRDYLDSAARAAGPRGPAG